jgi:GT2 family glycosyltransferase
VAVEVAVEVAAEVVSPRPMRVAAIVVDWNSAEHLGACLAALDAQDHPDLEVVVVDNASTDGTPALLRATRLERHPVSVRTNPTNRGFCGGVNDALARLDPSVEAVLLVNPDVVAAPDLVSRCVAALAFGGLGQA